MHHNANLLPTWLPFPSQELPVLCLLSRATFVLYRWIWSSLSNCSVHCLPILSLLKVS